MEKRGDFVPGKTKCSFCKQQAVLFIEKRAACDKHVETLTTLIKEGSYGVTKAWNKNK